MSGPGRFEWKYGPEKMVQRADLSVRVSVGCDCGTLGEQSQPTEAFISYLVSSQHGIPGSNLVIRLSSLRSPHDSQRPGGRGFSQYVLLLMRVTVRVDTDSVTTWEGI